MVCVGGVTAVAGMQILTDIFHFSIGGEGEKGVRCCFPAYTAPNLACYIGSQSFGLTGMKIILKITPPCIPTQS